MAIHAIIFDLDGVLIDSRSAHAQSWRVLAREMGVEISEAAMASTFGRQNRDIVPILFGDDRTAQEIRDLGRRKEAIYRDLVRGQVPVTPGAVALIRYYVDNGYVLAIGSSAPRANVDLALGEMGVTEHFSAIVSGEDIAVGKPDPAVFLAAARMLGASPGQCLVIEDSPAGVQAARSAGKAVVALAGSYPTDRLGLAMRVIDSLVQLIPADEPAG